MDQRNTEVYQRSSLRAIVLSSLEGINGTVFMYGQTGAGKTYTMLGASSLNLKKQPQTTQLDNTTTASEPGVSSPQRNLYNSQWT